MVLERNISMQRGVIYGLVLLSLPTLFTGQERKLRPAEVPTVVSASATKRFPGARISGWSKQTEGGKTTYEAAVSDPDGKRDAVFSEDGALVAVEQNISIADLPSRVRDAVTAKYPHAELQKAERITHNGNVDYEVDLAKAVRKEITVSSEGRILKEE
jgi:hypothetical protein